MIQKSHHENHGDFFLWESVLETSVRVGDDSGGGQTPQKATKTEKFFCKN